MSKVRIRTKDNMTTGGCKSPAEGNFGSQPVVFYFGGNMGEIPSKERRRFLELLKERYSYVVERWSGQRYISFAKKRLIEIDSELKKIKEN